MIDFFFKRDFMGDTGFERLTWKFLGFSISAMIWLFFGGLWVALIAFLLGYFN